MKRTITTLMVCVSAYALIAQEAFKLSKQQMYEDFDQLVTIVEQYNPQVKIKKLVCNYDIVSYINDRRCLVDTIESLGSFACFLETTIKMVHDIHTKKLRLKKNNELMTCLAKENIDTSLLKLCDEYYAHYNSKNVRPLFSFGNYLLYHKGRYYVMGSVVFSDLEQNKCQITNSELIKIGNLTVKQFIDSFPEIQHATLRWDYELKNFYTTSLQVPYTNLTFRDLNTGSNTIIDMKQYPIYGLKMQEAPKVYNDYTPKIYYFHKCHILYIYFPKMDEETKKTLLKKLNHFNNRRVDYVVFDVRDNKGGSDLVWSDVLQALIKDTIQLPCCIGVRKLFYPKWTDNITRKIAEESFDLYVESTDWNTFIPSKENLGFTGHFYVLQDHNTLSAAHSLSSICRLSDQFTSVGLSTGYIAGRGSGPFTFQLRNSGFTFTMECDIDVTQCQNIQDYFQDIPEYEMKLSLDEAEDYYYTNYDVLKNKKYLCKKDPFIRTVYKLIHMR